jgi:hypothetical protein
MVTTKELPVPLLAGYDTPRGARWTTLPGGGREWLWQRSDTDREGARPGDGFIDAGGLEECLPTVRGWPDHGDLWSRPWRDTGAGRVTIERPDFTLTRQLTDRAGTVVADYHLRANPGYRFIWAAHALFDLSPAARIEAPIGTPTRLYPDAAAPAQPDGPTVGPWPEPAGVRLDRLGPDDGTAYAAVLLECPTARLVDGPDTLTLHLECDGQPRSTALWRNLRGWPAPDPYRSVGVEPMLGTVFDLAEAGSGDAAEVPASGEVHWQLTISAYRITEGRPDDTAR